ncbi:MAG TPA: hypothetical protein VHP31_00910 [Caproicibacter sp.]|nr:hypothetical protein [Caproicibacter sp.]
MKIENHPAFKEPTKQDLPRICYILGGEDNPLKIGEHFALDYDCVKNEFIYFIDSKGNVCVDNYSRHLGDDTLCDIINHPEKIIRRIQFDENEKALFKAFHALGYDYWCRQRDGYLWASDHEPMLENNDFVFPCGSRAHHLGKEFLPHLAVGQMINVAAYLESEDK